MMSSPVSRNSPSRVRKKLFRTTLTSGIIPMPVAFFRIADKYQNQSRDRVKKHEEHVFASHEVLGRNNESSPAGSI